MSSTSLFYDVNVDEEISVTDLIEQIRRGYSVLMQYPEGRDLRAVFAKDEVFTRLAFGAILCNLFHWEARLRGKRGCDYRNYILERFSWLVPYEERPVPGFDEAEDKNKGRIIVTNHPSDNEMAIAGFWSMRRYPYKRIMYPIDLPGYEGFAGRFFRKFNRAAVDIVPIIPPGSFEFMGKLEALKNLKKSLEEYYLDVALDRLANGHNVVIAQQSEFQEYIFLDKRQYETGQSDGGQRVRSPIGALLMAAHRRGMDLDSFEIVPIAVELPEKAKSRQLNACSRYPIYVGEMMTAAKLVERSGGFRVDYPLLRMMADDIGLPPDLRYGT
jgi:hypothetical protein